MTDLAAAARRVADARALLATADESLRFSENMSYISDESRAEIVRDDTKHLNAKAAAYVVATAALDDDIAEIAAAAAEWQVAADGAAAGRAMLAAAGAANAWLGPEDGNGSSTLKVLVPDVAMERIDVFVQRMMGDQG